MTDTRTNIEGRLPHLDTLRAFAILLVLFYHFNISFFGKKGYLGVDLFFMLSGFLMSFTMLRDRHRHGTFRVMSFFERRFRRIVPSLYILILSVIIISMFFLAPHHLKRVAKESFYSIAFISNIYFFLKSDYFSPSMHSRPFLHTWSLSLEEQFYLIFGIMLLLANRTKKYSKIIFIALFISIILALSVLFFYACKEIFSETIQKIYFYLLPFRMIFFMGGVVLGYTYWKMIVNRQRAFVFNKHSGTVALLIGFVGYVFISYADMPAIISGFLAFIFWLPMFIFGGGILSSLGAHSLIKFVAGTSYQVYLVHWPILFFYRYTFYQEPSFWSSLIMIFMSFLLGWLLWKATNWTIAKGAFSARSVSIITSTSMAIVALAAYLIIDGGAKWRIPENRLFLSLKDYRDINLAQCSKFNKEGFIKCEIISEENAKGDILVIGDSHAEHLITGIKQTLRDYNIKLIRHPACPPFIGFLYKDDLSIKNFGWNCIVHNEKVYTYIRTHKFNAILISYKFYQKYLDNERIYQEMIEFDRFLRLKVQHVIWISPIPYPGINVPYCLSAPWWISDSFIKSRCRFNTHLLEQIKKYNLRMEKVLAPYRPINTIIIICGPVGKRCKLLNQNGEVLYRDSNHLTPQGSLFVMRYAKDDILRVLEK